MCLSYHEDITATVPCENETHREKMLRWQSISDHFIGMDYAHMAMRKTGGYKFPLINNQIIRLFNVRVGCGSCHILYANNQSHLVAKYQGGGFVPSVSR